MNRKYTIKQFQDICEELNGKSAEEIELSEDGEGRHLTLKVDGVWYLFNLSSMLLFKEVSQELTQER